MIFFSYKLDHLSIVENTMHGDVYWKLWATEVMRVVSLLSLSLLTPVA